MGTSVWKIKCHPSVQCPQKYLAVVTVEVYFHASMKGLQSDPALHC